MIMQTLTRDSYEEQCREAVFRVDPAFGFGTVGVTLSVPLLPASVIGASFAEHAFDVQSRTSTDTVILTGVGGVAVSSDLGRQWCWVAMPEAGKVRLRNSFTLSNGNRLLQEAAPSIVAGWPGPRLFLVDPTGRMLQEAWIGESPWHGPRAIDERCGTIMFAEYPVNAAKYRKDFVEKRAELEPLCRDCRVFRSRDQGRSWEVVFRLSWKDIRHFHTLVADPFDDGVWWLSSGDTPIECRVWRSGDDGNTWQEATDPSPQIESHPQADAYRMSAHRYTDLVILPDRMLWGTDDVLGPRKLIAEAVADTAGPRIGSRLVVTPKSVPLALKSHAYIGNQVRSIVDVGPAYLILTEAKTPAVFPGPQVLIMSKRDPDLVAPLFVAEVGSQAANTGFTYSMTSKAAKDGCFFSMRKSTDVFDGGPQVLKWRLDFA